MMFTFTSHVPHCPMEIRRAIGDHTAFTLSSRHVTTMQMLHDLLVASDGAVTALNIPDLSLLLGRDASTPRIPGALCQRLRDLRVALSFQPRAHIQLKALGTLLSAPGLERLELKATEHLTDAFLREEKYQLRGDEAAGAVVGALVLPLPGMLQLPTPAEARTEAIEADGARYGDCVFELLTGTRKLAAAAPEEEEGDAAAKKIENALRGLFERASHAPPPSSGALQALSMAPSSCDAVRAAASQTLAGLNARPAVLPGDEWRTGIALLLMAPLSPSLAHLSLQVLAIPPRCRFLAGLHRLETLRLAYCGIDDATLAGALLPDIAAMPSLRVLDLSRNRLSDADLRPLASGTVMHSLERLLLTHNNLGGRACSGLFQALDGNRVLRHIDLSYNRVFTEEEGLTFHHLSGWAAPEARLILPDIFSPEEVGCLNERMPDGSTLELVGLPIGDAGFLPDAAAASAALLR